MGMDEADEEEGDESDDDYNPHSDVRHLLHVLVLICNTVNLY